MDSRVRVNDGVGGSTAEIAEGRRGGLVDFEGLPFDRLRANVF